MPCHGLVGGLSSPSLALALPQMGRRTTGNSCSSWRENVLSSFMRFSHYTSFPLSGTAYLGRPYSHMLHSYPLIPLWDFLTLTFCCGCSTYTLLLPACLPRLFPPCICSCCAQDICSCPAAVVPTTTMQADPPVPHLLVLHLPPCSFSLPFPTPYALHPPHIILPA